MGRVLIRELLFGGAQFCMGIDLYGESAPTLRTKRHFPISRKNSCASETVSGLSEIMRYRYR